MAQHKFTIVDDDAVRVLLAKLVKGGWETGSAGEIASRA